MNNIINLRYNKKFPDYPHDIIHDISYIIETKPLNCFFFGKDYISTSVIEINSDIIWNPTDDNDTKEKQIQQNLSYLRNISYFITNIENKGFEKSYYDYGIHLYHSKFHEYNLTNKFSQKSVVNLLKFYYRQYLNHVKIYFNPTDEIYSKNAEYIRIINENK